MEQDFENYHHVVDRHCYGLWVASLWCFMSSAILTSSQYQNYRRIDLIVIHCSATRVTQRYTVDDCRRAEQKDTLRKLLERLKEDFPEAKVVGHRDLPGVKKECSCFEVATGSLV